MEWIGTLLGIVLAGLTYWLQTVKARKRDRILKEMWELTNEMGAALDSHDDARITALSEQLRLCREKYR